MKRRVALYARVSTAQQAEMYGLDAQVAALRASIGPDEKLVADPFVDDGVSGALLARPALTRLRDFVRRNDVDEIRCPEVSRLARDVDVFRGLLDEFGLLNVEVEFLGFPRGMDRAMRRFMLTNIANTAEFERAQIRQRTHDRGKLVKARRGEWAGGRWAYGYRSAVGPDGRRKMLVVVPDEARWVGFIYEQYIAGQSLKQIARELNRRGVPTGRRARRWIPCVVRNILRNPGYMGQGRYNVTKVPGMAERERARRQGVILRTTTRDASEWLTVAYPPIVSPALFATVQKTLTQNIRDRAGRTGDPVNVLRGLLICGGCGKRMRAKTIGRRWRYYQCANPDSTCRLRERADDLETAVWTTVVDLYTNPVRLRKDVEAFRKATAVDDVEVQSAVAHARTVVAKADKAVATLVDLIGDGDRDMPLADLRAKLTDAKERRDAARNALADAEGKAATVPAIAAADLDAFARGIAAKVRTTTDVEDRRAVLVECLTRVTVPLAGESLILETPLTRRDTEGDPVLSPSTSLRSQTSLAGKSFRLAVPRGTVARNPVPAGRHAP